VADEMAKSVGSVKVMQLRALRAAAAIGDRKEINCCGSIRLRRAK